MKAILYSFILIGLLSSCSSVDSLVRKGKYDEAFEYAVSRFSKNKKRKTEDVQALEKAYAGLLNRDLNEIKRLNQSFRPENAAKIVRIYENIERRQNNLAFILPVISEDGYEARFEIRDYSLALRDAIDSAALAHYEKGKEMLASAHKSKDKNLARSAYNEFEKAESYVYNFRDVKALKEKALDMGHTVVLFEIYNNVNGRAGLDINHALWNYAAGRHDDRWHSFRFREDDDSDNGDFIVRVNIANLAISAEKENNNHFTESKEILIRTDKWMEKRDSIHVEVIKDIYENVTARVIETFREKNALLEGSVRWIDNTKKVVIADKPVSVHFNFNDRGMVYIGDARALREETKKRLDPNLDRFPADEEIVSFLINEYKNVLFKEVNRFKS